MGDGYFSSNKNYNGRDMLRILSVGIAIGVCLMSLLVVICK